MTSLAPDEDDLEVDVAPPLQSGAPGKAYGLILRLGGQSVWVIERDPGTALPAWCAERHMNTDGTFCLGLEKPKVEDETAATAFWQSLRTYLLYQQFADRNRTWPRGRWLSHGDAAWHQLDAEAAADACGLRDAYDRALEFGEGWLSGPLPALRWAIGRRASPHRCPVSTDGVFHHRRRLWKHCARCAAIGRLVEAECKRREEDERFIAMLRYCGRTCCGRMKVCALRDALAEAQP